MKPSQNYERAVRFRRLANKPAIMRAALRQCSAAELAALDSLIARAEAVDRRIQRERQAARLAKLAAEPAA